MASTEIEQLEVARRWITEKNGKQIHAVFIGELGHTELFEVEDEVVAIYPKSYAPNPNPDSWEIKHFLAASPRLVEDFLLRAPSLELPSIPFRTRWQPRSVINEQ